MPITFEKACMASVLWTGIGFDYSEGLPEICNRLVETLSRNEIINKINDTIGVSYITPKEKPFDIKEIPGRERIKIIHYSNFSMNSASVQDFTVRIHVCNRDLGMKCKITAFSVFDLKSATYLEAKTEINTIRQKQREICDHVYRVTYDVFKLGDVNYTSCITTVESNDPDVDSIIESTFAKDMGKFEFLESVGERKIVDAWKLLLDETSGSILEQETEITRLEKTLSDKIKDEDVDEFKIRIYQTKMITIPALVVNYAKGIGAPCRRFITAITKPNCSVQVTTKMLRSYLNRT